MSNYFLLDSGVSTVCILPKGYYLDVVGGPSTPHDP
jgi:hypothetical protein